MIFPTGSPFRGRVYTGGEREREIERDGAKEREGRRKGGKNSRKERIRESGNKGWQGVRRVEEGRE